MTEPYLANVTVFRSLFDSKETPYILSIEDIYERIKYGTGGVDKVINNIRTIADKELRNNEKKKLKAILFSGEFSQRNDNSLTEHSGFMITDFDNFPNEKVYQEWKDKLIKKETTFMLFRSPSGNGLKAVIRIPKSDSKTHPLRHEAYGEEIDCDYFDSTSKNISRVCFESFDPEIYVNVYAKEFEKIATHKGYTYQERPPLCVLKNESEIIERIMKFDFKYSFIQGQRNEYLFRVACCFNEYGLSKNVCESYLWNNVVKGEFSHEEFLLTIKSAYKKSNGDTKYFDDVQKLQRVEIDIKKGVSEKEIKKKYDIDEEVIDDVKKTLDKQNSVFWNLKVKKGGEVDITINEWKYCEFLVNNGFLKFYPENAEKPSFVRVLENKVNLISGDQIKDFVLNHLKKIEQIEVWNYCSRATYLFTDKYLNFIDSIDLKMLCDTKDISYIPFLNGVVEVTKDKYKLIPFIDVKGYIWEKQIINRVFFKQENDENDFKSFVLKVSANDSQRYEAMCSTLGYLIHAHKDKTDQKAIIFNDEEISDNPNGGSGKSVTLTALSHFRRLVKIDGKTFNPMKSDFVYQRVNVDTQILGFDDVKKNFNFENLFSLITEGITVNRKNKDEIFIPFERSAKIVITTNYTINGSGNSHDRRRHEIEFHQYFNANKTPLDEYGKLLFDQWEQKDWNAFDNFMINNLQLYLKKGLIKSKSINGDEKRFIQQTNKEFYDWVKEGNLKENEPNFTTEKIADFKIEYSEYYNLTPKTFISWCSAYATHKGLSFEKGKDTESNRRYFLLINKSGEQTEIKF